MSLLGHFIRKSRKEKKLTLEAVAETSGLSPSYLSMIEHGKKKPGIRTLKKLSEALDIDIITLLAKCNLVDQEQTQQPLELKDVIMVSNVAIEGKILNQNKKQAIIQMINNAKDIFGAKS